MDTKTSYAAVAGANLGGRGSGASESHAPVANPGASAPVTQRPMLIPGGQAAVAKPDVNAAKLSQGTLYIGDLDPQVNEKLLWDLLDPIARPTNIRIVRDKTTRTSKCYAYVNFSSQEDAELVMNQLNYFPYRGKYIRIMVRHYDPKLRESGVGNVHINNLPRSVDNRTLYATFRSFGPILSSKLVIDGQGNSLGYGYVHFSDPADANNAIAAINGKYVDDHQLSVQPFVKSQFRQKQDKEATFRNLYVKFLAPDITHDKFKEFFSQFGPIDSLALSLDENGKFKGFAHVSFEQHDDAVKAIEAVNGKVFEGISTPEPGLYVARAMSSEERRKIQEDKKKSISEERAKYVNMYVKNFPEDFDDAKLTEMFKKYGELVSVRVERDENGKSRGFGYVCFKNGADASIAINELQSAQYHNSKPMFIGLHQKKKQREEYLERVSQSAAMQRHGGMAMGMMRPTNMVPPGNRYNQYGQRGTYVQPVMSAQAGRGQGMPTRMPGMGAGGRGGRMGMPPVTATQNARNLPTGMYGNPDVSAQSALMVKKEGDAKQARGMVIYRKIQEIQKEMNLDETDIRKIVGMFLELPPEETKDMLESTEEIKKSVAKAVKVLKEENDGADDAEE